MVKVVLLPSSALSNVSTKRCPDLNEQQCNMFTQQRRLSHRAVKPLNINVDWKSLECKLYKVIFTKLFLSCCFFGARMISCLKRLALMGLSGWVRSVTTFFVQGRDQKGHLKWNQSRESSILLKKYQIHRNTQCILDSFRVWILHSPRKKH